MTDMLDLGPWECTGPTMIPTQAADGEPVRCRRCHRELTDHISVALGIGPDCLDYLTGGNAATIRHRHDVSPDQLALVPAPLAKETTMTTTTCTVRDRRAVMDDDEFWADVAESLQPTMPDDYPDDDPDDGRPVDVPGVTGPCPECGESGACAWDAEGRPLIHATRSTSDGDR